MKDFLDQLNMMIPLLISAILGLLIGFERKARFKEAGVKTHTIVCIGSALMMVISKNAFGSDADSARVAAQIVAGVGFLGAGMIVYKQNQVHGLTTAAGIWATAGVGMACGGEKYYLAVGATILLIIMQSILHSRIKLFKSKKFYSVKIEFQYTGNENKIIKEIFGTDRLNKLQITRKNDMIVYSATITTSREFSSQYLTDILDKHEFILYIERCDNN
ncbi:MAG: MgtC/SapB family protein [Clostridia bacterium]|nr:MgtC/SapB family protein [Clostridia bacterium]